MVGDKSIFENVLTVILVFAGFSQGLTMIMLTSYSAGASSSTFAGSGSGVGSFFTDSSLMASDNLETRMGLVPLVSKPRSCNAARNSATFIFSGSAILDQLF